MLNIQTKRLKKLERRHGTQALEHAKRLVRCYLFSKTRPEHLTPEDKLLLEQTKWEALQEAHGVVWRSSRAQGNKGDLDTTLRFVFTG